MVQLRDPVSSTSLATMGRAVVGELRLWVDEFVSGGGKTWRDVSD